MVYAIILAIVVLLVVFFVFLRPKGSGEAGAGEAGKALERPKQKVEGAREQERAEAKASARPAPGASAAPAEEPARPGPSVPAAARSAAPAAKAAESLHERDVAGLRKGLAKTRGEQGLLGKLTQLFAGKKEIDPAIAEQIEEALLTSDVGVATTQVILERIRDGLQKKELSNSEAVLRALRAEASRILSIGGGGLVLSSKPTVVLMVGVNGVGKTTTIGKLATKLKADGKSIVLAAGDTFRAAAVQQLDVWGKRVGCEVARGKDGADPGAVIFDAVQKAKDAGADVVLADTAGRLQTKTPLMDELKKIARTMPKAMEGAPHETLLVLDATNGQNAISQAKMFRDAIPLTGIVLTKLDGTAKGGVILGICDELKLPVRYVGLGERPDDLREFVPDDFVEALLGAGGDETAAA